MDKSQLTELQFLNELSGRIIGAAIEVHKELGPGLLEVAYEICLTKELMSRGLKVETQIELPLIYKGEQTGKTFRVDMLVDDTILVELKHVEQLMPVHEDQLMTYLKLTGKKLGLLINFNVPFLKDGIRRRLNGFPYDGIKPVRG